MLVSNDVVNDQRVLRGAATLLKTGFEVNIIGRLLPGSLPAAGLPFRITRLRMFFRRGFFFYAFLNIRLFLFLLFREKGFIVANDLDTLMPAWLMSKLRRAPLVYDSHEYFTGVPEIQNRRLVKCVWKWIEKHTVPRIPHLITVNASIAALYREEYGIEFRVVRNLSRRWSGAGNPSHAGLGLPENKKILVLQGSGINIDRGAEELVSAMTYLPDSLLLIIGSGDVIPQLKKMSKEMGIDDRIRFLGKMPYHRMMQYTQNADLGLSLDKDTSLNQRYSLPNKLFDYIQAGIPVLASPLPEVMAIVEHYQVGEILRSYGPVEMAGQIREMLKDPGAKRLLKEKLLSAAETLCWEKEEEAFRKVYEEAGLVFRENTL